MDVRSWWRQLRGREHTSVRLLGDQVRHARTAVAALREVADGSSSPQEAGTDVTEAEQRGDEARRAVVRELSAALAPPLDRTDLFRLSRSIDDVLDNLHDFAREMTLLGAAEPERFVPLLGAIDDALERLADAIAHLDQDDRSRSSEPVQLAKQAGAEVRRSYDEAIAELLTDPVDATMLRTRELLRRLDVVGLRLGEAADALADGAVKRHR